MAALIIRESPIVVHHLFMWLGVRRLLAFGVFPGPVSMCLG